MCAISTLSEDHFELTQLKTTKPTFVSTGSWCLLPECLQVSSLGPCAAGSPIPECQEFSAQLPECHEVTFLLIVRRQHLASQGRRMLTSPTWMLKSFTSPVRVWEVTSLPTGGAVLAPVPEYKVSTGLSVKELHSTYMSVTRSHLSHPTVRTPHVLFPGVKSFQVVRRSRFLYPSIVSDEMSYFLISCNFQEITSRSAGHPAGGIYLT